MKYLIHWAKLTIGILMDIKLLVLFSVIIGISVMGCSGDGSMSETVEKEAVHTVLDDWHLAASEANAEQYFSHFASDSAIFMGTDATERWTIAEFEDWASPYFDEGQAWDFSAVERQVYVSDEGNTAWFDESLDTPNLGPARGSGVLVKKDKNWKIVHYNLSIPIPNAIVDTVVKQVDEELNTQQDGN